MSILYDYWKIILIKLILTSKWRIYRGLIIAEEKTLNAIIKATGVLHNFVKMSENKEGLIKLLNCYDLYTCINPTNIINAKICKYVSYTFT